MQPATHEAAKEALARAVVANPGVGSSAAPKGGPVMRDITAAGIPEARSDSHSSTPAVEAADKEGAVGVLRGEARAP